jgi:arginine utilization protein RocB
LSWFEGYELLGDDIVIFDKIVALKYLEMMQQLGVEINLSKSVVSDPGSVVEFAKRTSVKGVDVSAISLKMVEAASDLKTRVQVALYLGLKTGLSVGNYFKALHALGPSLLYSTTTPTKAYENALARMVAQLVKKDGSNLFAYLASNLNEDSPESFFEGDVMSMKTGKAARLIDDLVKGKDVVLRPTDEQESLFEYLSYDLKSGLAAKVARTYASILESFSKSFPVAVNVLFSP